MRGKSNKADELIRMSTLAFSVTISLIYEKVPVQLRELARKMQAALDTAEHGPGALELGRWEDDGGPALD